MVTVRYAGRIIGTWHTGRDGVCRYMSMSMSVYARALRDQQRMAARQ